MPRPAKKSPDNPPSNLPKYDVKDGPFWACEPDSTKKILFSKTGPGSEKITPANTLVKVFEIAAKRRGDKVALRTENMNSLKKGEKAPPALPLAKWTSWTWSEYVRDVRLLARALLSIGMNQHDSVNVFGFNSPEWLMGQMAAIFAGGMVAGIYPSDTADQVQYKSFHSNACAAFIENESAFAKFAEVIEDLPYMKAIIAWSMDEVHDLKRSDGSVVKVYRFKDFLSLGKSYDEKKLDNRISKIEPEHCAALIYTSGTTGRPKAVMISHDNIVFEAMTAIPLSGIGMVEDEERIVSYLPLSHVAGMLFDIIAPVVITAYLKGWVNTNFARPYDLKTGTIGQRLVAVEPTLFLGVPRVWEKIAEKLQAIGAKTKGIKKSLAANAKKKGLQASMNQMIGGSGKTPFMYGVYAKLLKTIKGKLGLSKCRFCVAGAAPMTRETLTYFGSLGINVNEVYGMSECCGAATFSTDPCHQWSTVGFELPSCEVRCFKVNADGSKTECPRAKDILRPTEAEQGELCFRGRNIMIGYLANPLLGDDHVEEIKKKNAEAIDEEGWLHSGDKGSISKLGMIRITGRYKELIIGAGGENIAPVPIEDEIKKLCPYVSNVMMFGDKKKFNIALLTLKAVGATGEAPGSNKLDGPARVYGETIEEACSNKTLIDAIIKAIKDVGNNGDVTPSNAAKIQKFTILPIDFSVQTDELTATLKLKRSVVAEKYEDLIDAMYESKEIFVPYSTVGSYDLTGNAETMSVGSFKADNLDDFVDDEDVQALEAADQAGEGEEEDPRDN